LGQFWNKLLSRSFVNILYIYHNLILTKIRNLEENFVLNNQMIDNNKNYQNVIDKVKVKERTNKNQDNFSSSNHLKNNNIKIKIDNTKPDNKYDYSYKPFTRTGSMDIK